MGYSMTSPAIRGSAVQERGTPTRPASLVIPGDDRQLPRDHLEDIEAAQVRVLQMIREHRKRFPAPTSRVAARQSPRLTPGTADTDASGAELILGARREAWFAQDLPASASSGPDETEARYAALRDAGVKVRALYTRQFAALDGADAHFERAADLGVVCRLVPVRQVFMAVVDRECVVVDRAQEPGPRWTQIFRDPGDVAVLAEMYENSWASSDPVGATMTETLTCEQLTALRMMSAGMKDDRIARQMGISPRTLSRLVARAMTELGVRSRFEAGVRAKELGLLG